MRPRRLSSLLHRRLAAGSRPKVRGLAAGRRSLAGTAQPGAERTLTNRKPCALLADGGGTSVNTDPVIAAVPLMVLLLVAIAAGAYTYAQRGMWGYKISPADAHQLAALAAKPAVAAAANRVGVLEFDSLAVRCAGTALHVAAHALQPSPVNHVQPLLLPADLPGNAPALPLAACPSVPRRRPAKARRCGARRCSELPATAAWAGSRAAGCCACLQMPSTSCTCPASAGAAATSSGRALAATPRREIPPRMRKVCPALATPCCLLRVPANTARFTRLCVLLPGHGARPACLAFCFTQRMSPTPAASIDQTLPSPPQRRPISWWAFTACPTPQTAGTSCAAVPARCTAARWSACWDPLVSVSGQPVPCQHVQGPPTLPGTCSVPAARPFYGNAHDACVAPMRARLPPPPGNLSSPLLAALLARLRQDDAARLHRRLSSGPRQRLSADRQRARGRRQVLLVPAWPPCDRTLCCRLHPMLAACHSLPVCPLSTQGPAPAWL